MGNLSEHKWTLKTIPLGRLVLVIVSAWNLKHQVFNSCNWMTPNHYMKNGCFIKHNNFVRTLSFHQASIKKTGCLGFQVIEQQKFGEFQNHHELFKDNFDKHIDPLQVKLWVAHFSATRKFWWLPRRMTVCVQLSTKIVFVLKKNIRKMEGRSLSGWCATYR